MSDLPERLRRLEGDLTAQPMRHFTYNDLPFAVFCYPPEDEWAMRRELSRLQTRLQQPPHGFTVHRISLADLLWQGVDEAEGLDEVARMEARQGFAAAQRQVQDNLSYVPPRSSGPRPLARLLLAALAEATVGPGRHLAFIVRTAALAPAIYRVSILLDELKGHTHVPSVLFMPATTDAGGLRFMGVAENEGRGSYHTKVYMD